METKKKPRTIGGFLVTLNVVNQKKYLLTSQIKKQISQIVRWIENNLSQKDCFFNLILIDEKTSQKLNRQYRQKDYPAEVLTFPFALSYHQIADCSDLGDIFLCYPLVKKKTLPAFFNQEICQIFIHGLLHLFGYDHQIPKARKQMWNLEAKILACASSKAILKA